MSSSQASGSNPLLYSCIYHDTILSEASTTDPDTTGTTSNLASLLLPKIPKSRQAQKLTYTHDSYHVHYSTLPTPDSVVVFLVITTASAQRQTAFSFLKSLQSAFVAEHPTASLPTSPAYALASFNRTLAELLAEVGKNQSYDRAREVRGEIENVRGIMSENIERVLERGERIELLVDKTGRLEVGAGEFRRRSRGLKRKMWWKNVKINILLGFAIIFIIYLFVGFGCGLPGWQKCLGK